MVYVELLLGNIGEVEYREGGYVTGYIHIAEEPWLTTHEPVTRRSRCINAGAGFIPDHHRMKDQGSLTARGQCVAKEY
jgi:hypothetical protein